MDYNTLIAGRQTVGSVSNWINATSVDAATVVGEGMQWIYQRARIRQMITSTTGTATASATSLTLPTTYRSPKHFQWTGTARGFPDYVPLEEVYASQSWDNNGVIVTGKPRKWSTDALLMVFDTATDVAYPFVFSYYQDLPALTTSGTNTANIFTSRYPRLVRSALMFMGFEFLKDKTNQDYWYKVALAEIDACNRDDDLEKEGEILTMVVDEGNAPQGYTG